MVMKMEVVSMEEPPGHFLVPPCRTETLVPDLGFAMAAARKVSRTMAYSDRGFRSGPYIGERELLGPPMGPDTVPARLAARHSAWGPCGPSRSSGCSGGFRENRRINAPRGHRPRGWVPLGRNGRGQDEEDGLGKPKFSIPKFEGGADVEEYLTWELKIEKLWSLHPNYSEDRKIKLASSEFDGYALRWWDSLVRNRDEDGAQPIRTWRAMKEAMTSRFVPTNYLRNIFDKLTLLRQGVKTVDEYYMEMEMLMQRGRVRESLEMTMQRFLNGLKYDVKGIVRHYTYTNMNQLLHHAREAESQLAEEAKVKDVLRGAFYTPCALYSAGAFDALRSLLYSA
ncbi:hypothetical protein QYE76_034886 [Lolium multiflorum]|uniref:Retrotransposon gag domain-containing protein n=1 Tax=Lolium multiflorum TaxID=4521 RepID=A0AAD8QY70_LOLMU|nr:hypothetical protein QYE76_034886 [Lolium multiflorum]